MYSECYGQTFSGLIILIVVVSNVVMNSLLEESSYIYSRLAAQLPLTISALFSIIPRNILIF